MSTFEIICVLVVGVLVVAAGWNLLRGKNPNDDTFKDDGSWTGGADGGGTSD